MTNGKFSSNSYKAISTGLISISALCFFSYPIYANAQTATSINLEINDFIKEVPYETYSQWLSFSPSLIIDPSYSSEIENQDFCFENIFFCELTRTEISKNHIRKITDSYFDKEKGRLFLEKLSLEANKPPVDAKFRIEGEKMASFTIEENGLEIDIEKSLEKLSEALSNDNNLSEQKKISLPFNIIEPKIKSSDVNSLGINTILGQGSSNFKGSTRSRIHNIKTATEKYNGLLLEPEEEFSFVDILGPVDGEHGYLPELVIKQDRTEPEFGGGICQVSTTAFRAAIYSGLEITARKNHAYAVQYYSPHGMDATIYIPKPDLKFKNNTPGHILIQTEIIGTELIFKFFGTSDGRKIEVDGPHIIQKNPDGSMRTTFTQKVTDKSGNEIINEAFNSFYDSPSKYPHPGEEKFTKKPDDWSSKQWEIYKKANRP